MKIFRRILYVIAGLIALILLSAHLLLTYKSKELLQEVVQEASKGKYKLQAEKVKFYYIHAGISASKLSITPVANDSNKTTLHIDQVNIRLASIWKLIFSRELQVEQIELAKPDITIYAVAKKKDNTPRKGLATTIEEVQQKLFEVIRILNVRHLEIKDASIKIFPPANIKLSHFALNHIHIQLKDLNIGKSGDQRGDANRFEGWLKLLRPDVDLPDTSVAISMGQLTADIKTRSLQIDSVHMANTTPKGHLRRQLDLSTVRVAGFNWQRYLGEGTIEFDTVLARSGAALLHLRSGVRDSARANTRNRVYSGPTFIIHHTFVSDIAYNLRSGRKDRKEGHDMLLNLKGDSLYFREVAITNGATPAVTLDSMNVVFKDFKESNEDKKQSFSFKGLQVKKNTLVINRYLFETNNEERHKNYFRIAIPEFRLDDYSLEELFEKRLAAAAVTLNDPDITIDIRKVKEPGSAPRKNINESLTTVFQKASSKVKLGEIVIRNGDFTLLPTLDPKDKVTLTGLSLVIDATKIPQISSAMDLVHAIKQLNSSGFEIVGHNIHLHVQEMSLLNSPRGLHFGTIDGLFGEGKIVHLKGVTALNASQAFDPTSADGFHLSHLLVDSGFVTIKKGSAKPAAPAAAKKEIPVLKIDSLALNHMVLKLHQGNKLGVSAAMNVSAADFLFKDRKVFWTQLNINADETEAVLEKTSFSAGSMAVSQPGTITIYDAKGFTKSHKNEVDFNANEISIQIGLQSTDAPQLVVQSIKMKKPTLNLVISKGNKTNPVASPTKTQNAAPRNISLGELILEEPVFNLTIKDADGHESNSHQLLTGRLHIKNLNTLNAARQPEFSAAQLSYNTSVLQNKIAGRQVNAGYLNLLASNLKYNPATKHFALHVDSVYLRDIKQEFIGNKQDTINVVVGEAGLANMDYKKGDSIQWLKLLHTATWWANNVDLSFHTPKQMIKAWHINTANHKGISFSADSFAIIHRMTRDEWWGTSAYEKGYETIAGGKLAASGIRVNMEDKKPTIDIAKFTTQNLRFKTEKDKTKLEDTITYRPLLASQLMNLPIRMHIDSLLLQGARVDAHEISRKTGKQTHIFFDDLNGYVKNLKTYDPQPLDTLEMRIRARFYGTDVVRVHFKQSYYDSLQGFWMRVRMSKFNMPEMNKMLTPLLGLKIESGSLDSLLLIANGNKYFAFGTMDLRYHHLRARLLKTNETKGKVFVSIANFFTGLFLRKHDNGRTNLLYKERVQKRGIFNFWAKISLEGLLTNLGIKRDKAEKKKFEKAIEKYQLPEKYWQDDDN